MKPIVVFMKGENTMSVPNYPRTAKELREADFDTLNAMWKHTSELRCGKDSSTTGGKIFKEVFETEFTYADLCNALSAVAERYTGWIKKGDSSIYESKDSTPVEMVIGRKNLAETKKLQNKISVETFEQLNDFLAGIPKHDVPKVLDQIIAKGLECYRGCYISYVAEEKERIK